MVQLTMRCRATCASSCVLIRWNCSIRTTVLRQFCSAARNADGLMSSQHGHNNGTLNFLEFNELEVDTGDNHFAEERKNKEDKS